MDRNSPQTHLYNQSGQLVVVTKPLLQFVAPNRISARCPVIARVTRVTRVTRVAFAPSIPKVPNSKYHITPFVNRELPNHYTKSLQQCQIADLVVCVSLNVRIARLAMASNWQSIQSTQKPTLEPYRVHSTPSNLGHFWAIPKIQSGKHYKQHACKFTQLSNETTLSIHGTPLQKRQVVLLKIRRGLPLVGVRLPLPAPLKPPKTTIKSHISSILFPSKLYDSCQTSKQFGPFLGHCQKEWAILGPLWPAGTLGGNSERNRPFRGNGKHLGHFWAIAKIRALGADKEVNRWGK